MNTTKMWVCGLETSSKYGEIAILDPVGKCIKYTFTESLSHAKDLFPGIKTILDKCGLKLEDIDLIAVDHGPGSYTGIRIGITAAKMLAFSMGKPVVPVNSLDLLLENVVKQGIDVAAPILDAKLNQVYATACRFNPLEKIFSNFVGGVKELLSKLPPEAVVFGDGAVRYRDQLNSFSFGKEEWVRPRAETVARLGKKAFLEGKGIDADSLSPLYLRVSEAERKLKKRKRS